MPAAAGLPESSVCSASFDPQSIRLRADARCTTDVPGSVVTQGTHDHFIHPLIRYQSFVALFPTLHRLPTPPHACHHTHPAQRLARCNRLLHMQHLRYLTTLCGRRRPFLFFLLLRARRSCLAPAPFTIVRLPPCVCLPQTQTSPHTKPHSQLRQRSASTSPPGLAHLNIVHLGERSPSLSLLLFISCVTAPNGRPYSSQPVQPVLPIQHSYLRC